MHFSYIVESIFQTVKIGIAISFSAFLSTLAFVFIDSVYFGHLKVLIGTQVISWDTILLVFNPSYWSSLVITVMSLSSMNSPVQGRLAITPLNSLLYNLNPENLKMHGEHFRITHLLVNFPMLFGPLALLFIFYLVFRRKVCQIFK